VDVGLELWVSKESMFDSGIRRVDFVWENGELDVTFYEESIF
jgi:hypothetical protein